MNELQGFYLKSEEVTKKIYKFDLIKRVKPDILKNKIYNDIYKHLMDVLPTSSNIEILKNINYHSIIWNFLIIYAPDSVNGIYQEFKTSIYKKVGLQEGTSKLNNLGQFNDVMYLFIIA